MRSVTAAFVLACLASFAAPGLAQQQITSMSVPVAALDNPQQLDSMDVVDPAGAPVGHVVKVKTGSDGKASRVMVLLSTPEGMGRAAWIRPERLAFDKRKLVVVAAFTPAQLTQLAATATTPTGIDTSRSSGMVSRPTPSSGDASPPMGY